MGVSKHRNSLPVFFARNANLINEVVCLAYGRIKTTEERSRRDTPNLGVAILPESASGLHQFFQEHIQFLRKCKDWIRWNHGFTLKEHRETLDKGGIGSDGSVSYCWLPQRLLRYWRQAASDEPPLSIISSYLKCNQRQMPMISTLANTTYLNVVQGSPTLAPQRRSM